RYRRALAPAPVARKLRSPTFERCCRDRAHLSVGKAGLRTERGDPPDRFQVSECLFAQPVLTATVVAARPVALKPLQFRHGDSERWPQGASTRQTNCSQPTCLDVIEDAPLDDTEPIGSLSHAQPPLCNGTREPRRSRRARAGIAAVPTSPHRRETRREQRMTVGALTLARGRIPRRWPAATNGEPDTLEIAPNLSRRRVERFGDRAQCRAFLVQTGGGCLPLGAKLGRQPPRRPPSGSGQAENLKVTRDRRQRPAELTGDCRSRPTSSVQSRDLAPPCRPLTFIQSSG